MLGEAMVCYIRFLTVHEDEVEMDQSKMQQEQEYAQKATIGGGHAVMFPEPWLRTVAEKCKQDWWLKSKIGREAHGTSE